jgi:cytochrome c-type biogenesis protein
VDSVSLFAAFVAGVLSFISPCVLPLVPGYLSFVSGVSLEEMRARTDADAARAGRRKVFIASVAFVVGFSLVFISLGASASLIGQFLMERLTLLGKIAGVILVIFGLHTMGVFKIGALYSEKRIQTNRTPAGPFGWTPCIGPILAAILAVAAAQDTVGQGVLLLAVYSAGLGIPFLATSLGVNQFFAAFARVRRYYKAIEVAAGALMIVVGVLIFTNRFTLIAQYLTPYLPTF